METPQLRSTAETDSQQPKADEAGLHRSLDNRHIVLLALGGIIGAGLLAGSGAVINETGPAAVLSYAISGLLMIFVIRAIGEMAVARPSSGSVAAFPRLGLGNWAGFTVGWLYRYFWVIVSAIEAVAAAGILVKYTPGVPAWVLCLALMVLLTGLNLLSVKAYSEAEFWFASIKVIAITLIIVVTALFVLGAINGDESPGLSNPTTDGGIFPHGVMAAVVGSVTAVGLAVILCAYYVRRTAARSCRPPKFDGGNPYAQNGKRLPRVDSRRSPGLDRR